MFEKKSKAGFVATKGNLGVSSCLIIGMSRELREPDLVYIEEPGNSQKDHKINAEWHWTGKNFTQVRTSKLWGPKARAWEVMVRMNGEEPPSQNLKPLSMDNLEKLASKYLNGGDSI